MSAIPKPVSTDEMIHQLWFAVIGSNGDGIASRMRRVEQKVDKLEQADTLYLLERARTCPNVASINELKDITDILARRPEKRALKAVTYIGIACGGAVVSLFIARSSELIKVLIGG